MREADPESLAALDWYHTLELGGYTTAGVYDHRKVEAFYGVPADLRGKRVLDVGAGDGYFSFLFEALGAEVTALNPQRWDQEDFLPSRKADWQAENELVPPADKFEIARELLGSRARQIKGNLYDLARGTHGVFDLVFCGSVLCHLTDPLRALIRLRDVCAGLCIVATPIDLQGAPERPTALFIGTGHAHTFWIPNDRCLHDLLVAAGFAQADHCSTFNLASERGPVNSIPHSVFHASV